MSGCARRSLRSHPRINPSAQPSDVAGGSRSKALELTLIVEWCGFAAGSCAAVPFCGGEPAREGGLTADRFLYARTWSNCRSCRRLRSFDLASAFALALDLLPLRQASLRDRSRNEGTPSPSERAVRRGKAFGLPFRWAGTPAFEKVSRCKSETASRSTRSNGYASKTHKNPNPRQTKTPGITRAFCIDLINERGK